MGRRSAGDAVAAAVVAGVFWVPPIAEAGAWRAVAGLGLVAVVVAAMLLRRRFPASAVAAAGAATVAATLLGVCDDPMLATAWCVYPLAFGRASRAGGPFLVLAGVVAGQEFRAGQLGVTLLAMPRRGRVLAAKLLATGLFVLAVAVVMAGVSVGFMYAAVKDWNPGLLVTGETFLGHARFLAFAVTYSLIGLAVTVAARSSLAGVVCTVVLFAVTMIQAAPDLDALLPLSAARNLLLDPGVNDLSAGRGTGCSSSAAGPP